jgi:cell division septation protein DedD
MDRGGLRDIEQIQEKEGESSRLGGLVLASLGTACIVFAAIALTRKPAPPPGKGADPLDDLVARTPAASSARRDLTAADVTFPSMLSDSDHPTTALAAIGGPLTSASPPFVLPPGSPTVPPPAGDKLPVVPLPANRVIGASPVVTDPRDPLTTLAKDRSTPKEGSAVEAGHAGAFVLQVASFRTEGEAQTFSNVLRQRGHHAYVEAATIPGRGIWHRVRIGPFKYSRDATKYRTEFEAKEHIVPFVIEAEKEKKVNEQRDAERKLREAKRRLRTRRAKSSLRENRRKTLPRRAKTRARCCAGGAFPCRVGPSDGGVHEPFSQSHLGCFAVSRAARLLGASLRRVGGLQDRQREVPRARHVEHVAGRRAGHHSTGEG